jgi:hypothetical protein
MNLSVEIGSYKYEVCGQVNVINLFREEDKRAKKIVAMRAERKGNFARGRSHSLRANFRADRTIARICSGSHLGRSQFFASRRIFGVAQNKCSRNFFAIENIF